MGNEIFADPEDAALDAPRASDTPTRPPPANGSALQSQVYSTAQLPVGEQFDGWRGQCGSVVEMLEPGGPRPGYAARYETWKFGPFALSTVVAEAATYRRTKAQARRDAIDHWVVSVARRGTHGMRTERGLSTAPTGMPYIFSFGEAFEGRRSDIDWLCLFVPRETFPELGPTIDRCRHVPLDGAMGRLLGGYLDLLEAQLPTVTEAELPRLVAATRAMVAACVAPSAQTGPAGEAEVEQARLERVRQAIRRNLRSPTLTPKRLCRLAGMSRSQLYRLFEPVGGVSRYIQAERLREAHRALSDPDNRRDIRKVGEDLGFFDPSTFSRAFRREFGCTPTELRMSALSGQAFAPVRTSAGPVSGADFASLLRQL